MPVYRLYKLRESQREHFRWAPHTSGTTFVKQKDYEENGAMEADTPYSAWFRLRDAGQPLQVGDLLEQPDGELRIYKYVGFEQAQWALPEATTGFDTGSAVTDPPAAVAG